MIEFKNNVGVFDSCPTVENISVYSYRELLQYYHNKLKETIEKFNKVEEDFNKLDKYCKSNIEYLLNEGMYEELKIYMNKLYEDGLLSSVVNENLLIDLDKRFESIIGLNFLDYGGVNDGITDNRIALQNLINELNKRGGGKIFFPKGNYYFSRKENTIYSINVESNISFIGSGMGTTTFLIGDGTENDGEGYSLFYHNRNTPVKNATYTNFTVDAYKMTINEELNGYTHKGKALFFEGAINCVFRDIEILGTPSTGFGVDFMNNCVIDNVNCYECGRLWVSEFDDGKGNLIEGAGGAGIGIGTGLYEVENVKIVNCTCVKCGHFGIFLEHQNMFNSFANKISKGNIIANNIVHHCRHSGIGVRGGSNVIVSNNNVYENKYGLVVDSGETSLKDLLTIKDLLINGNVLKGNTECGIKLGNNLKFDNILISNNILRYNSIGLQFINDNPTITNNNFKLIGNMYNNNSIDIKLENENIKGYENNDKFSVECGKGYFNSTSYLTTSTNIFNNFQSIEFKISFSKVANQCLFSTKQEETTESNEVKGMTLLITDENKLILRYNMTTGGERKTINFNNTFEKDTIIYFKIYRDDKECVIKYKINDSDDFLTLENDSTDLLTDVNNAFGINKNMLMYFGKEYDGNVFKNFASGLTIYYLKIVDNYGNSKEYGFNNVGIDKIIKDINNSGYDILSHNNFIQKLN